MIIINKWLTTNRLNLDKTKLINFKNPKLNIVLDGTIIDEYEVITFLGVIIDNKLSWKQHICQTGKKLNSAIATINKLKYIIHRNTLLNIYYAFFNSTLIYCSHIWGTQYKTYYTHLQVLQNRAMRIIYNLEHRTNTDHIYKQFKIMKFKNIVEFNILKTMYMVYNNLSHPRILNLFKNKLNTNNVRNSQILILKKIKNTKQHQNIIFKGPLLWNHLKLKANFQIFKRHLEIYLISRI